MIITVRGEHEVEVQPTSAEVTLTVANEHMDANHAQMLTNHAMQWLVDSVRRWSQEPTAPVEEPTVHPLMTDQIQDQNPQVPPRARVTGSMDLVFKDVDRLRRATQEWATVPGLSVSRVYWTLSQEGRRHAENAAIGKALADATARAQAMADAAGFGKVELRQVADPGFLSQGGGGGDFGGGGARMYSMQADVDEPTGYDITPTPVLVRCRLDAAFDAQRPGAAPAVSAPSA